MSLWSAQAWGMERPSWSLNWSTMYSRRSTNRTSGRRTSHLGNGSYVSMASSYTPNAQATDFTLFPPTQVARITGRMSPSRGREEERGPPLSRGRRGAEARPICPLPPPRGRVGGGGHGLPGNPSHPHPSPPPSRGREEERGPPPSRGRRGAEAPRYLLPPPSVGEGWGGGDGLLSGPGLTPTPALPH